MNYLIPEIDIRIYSHNQGILGAKIQPFKKEIPSQTNRIAKIARKLKVDIFDDHTIRENDSGVLEKVRLYIFQRKRREISTRGTKRKEFWLGLPTSLLPGLCNSFTLTSLATQNNTSEASS